MTVTRRRLVWIEIVLLLGVSLGRSAAYSVLSIIEKYTRPEPISQQVTTMNTSVTPQRPWLDLAYQVAGIIFPLVPALLVLYLLTVFLRPPGGAFRAMGLDLKRPAFDWGVAFGICAAIGIPGLGLYLVAKQFGFNTTIVPANLSENWWTVPVLIALAFMNGALEEIVMIGYLFTRWRQLAHPMWVVVVVSAVVRATYHAYQGPGQFVGNLVMGLAFGWLYLKLKRVAPLVIAHSLIDVFAFVGYALLAPHITWLL